MKKLITLLLCAFVLFGCGPKKPAGLEDELYEIAKELLQITDDYFNNTATINETELKMQILLESNVYYFVEILENESLDKINTSVIIIAHSIPAALFDNEEGEEDSLLKRRNQLAELINEKKR